MVYSKFDHIHPWELRFTGSEDVIRVSPQDPEKLAKYEEGNFIGQTAGELEIDDRTIIDAAKARELKVSMVQALVNPLLDKIYAQIEKEAKAGKGSLWMPFAPFNQWCTVPDPKEGLQYFVLSSLTIHGYKISKKVQNDGKVALVIEWEDPANPNLENCRY